MQDLSSQPDWQIPGHTLGQSRLRVGVVSRAAAMVAIDVLAATAAVMVAYQSKATPGMLSALLAKSLLAWVPPKVKHTFAMELTRLSDALDTPMDFSRGAISIDHT